VLFYPDEVVRTNRDLRFKVPHLAPFVLPKGTRIRLMRRVTENNDGHDVWVVTRDEAVWGTLRIREDHFEIPNLLERLAREVEDAEALD